MSPPSEPDQVKRERKREQNRIAQRNYRSNQKKRIRELEAASGIPFQRPAAAVPSDTALPEPTPSYNESANLATAFQPLSDQDIVGDYLPIVDAQLQVCDDMGWQHGPTLDELSAPPSLPGRHESSDSPPRQPCSPLHMAIRRANMPMAKLLLRHGADVTLRDSSGLTALHAAVGSGAEDMVKLVLDARLADPNQTDLDGRTALFMAVELQNEALVKLLLEASINVNSKDASGHSALHAAVKANSESLVLLLLSHGAHIDG